MATVREWVIEQTTENGETATVNRLFYCFSLYARKHYNYSATATQGSDGESLLNDPIGTPRTVDCANLAKALMLLLNECLEDDDASVVNVGHADGFATKAASKCFDIKVSGNIRRPGRELSDISRCIFKSHYFVLTGNSTKLYLDPCMFTTYSTMDEVKDWLLTPGYAPFDRMRKINKQPEQFLVMIPSDKNKQLKAPGFQESYLLLSFSKLTSDEKRMFDGFRSSGLDLVAYNALCKSALDKINLELKNAGIKGGYKFKARKN